MKINKGRAAANILGLALVSALAAQPAYAQGLSRATSVLETFKSDLNTLVPIAAAIALVGLGVAYAMKMVEKDTLIRWAMGIIVAGSATTLATQFFGSGG